MKAYFEGGVVYLSCYNRKTGQRFPLPLRQVSTEYERMIVDALFDVEIKLIPLIKNTSPAMQERKARYEKLFDAILREAMRRRMYWGAFNKEKGVYGPSVVGSKERAIEEASL